MLPKLKEAKYMGEYRIWLSFEDSVKGEVDFENELWGEMFLPLKDKNIRGQNISPNSPPGYKTRVFGGPPGHSGGPVRPLSY